MKASTGQNGREQSAGNRAARYPRPFGQRGPAWRGTLPIGMPAARGARIPGRFTLRSRCLAPRARAASRNRDAPNAGLRPPSDGRSRRRAASAIGRAAQKSIGRRSRPRGRRNGRARSVHASITRPSVTGDHGFAAGSRRGTCSASPAVRRAAQAMPACRGSPPAGSTDPAGRRTRACKNDRPASAAASPRIPNEGE